MRPYHAFVEALENITIYPDSRTITMVLRSSLRLSGKKVSFINERRKLHRVLQCVHHAQVPFAPSFH